MRKYSRKVYHNAKRKGHTNEIDLLQIFYVGYDCIDMENILVDNENDIKHRCSIISIHNSEGHFHMFDKDTIAKGVCDMTTGKSYGFDGSSSDSF